MIEREIDIHANGNRLAGTLCLPVEQAQFPVVLMVHGSGPVDRDENMKGQKVDVFNAIAHRLAQGGIASVRYDKRGCGASQGDYYSAGYDDLVGDVVAWCDAIHRAEYGRAGPLLLLGHSEGCLVAAQASLRQPAVKGLALLCPFVDPVEDILIRQAQQIEQELSAKTGLARLALRLVTGLVGGAVANQRALIGKLRNSSEPSLRVWFERVPAKCLRELMRVNVAQVYAASALPLLLVGGEKDLQCSPADVARIAALASGPVEAHVVANLTHLLRRDDQAASLLGAHRLLTQPVDAEVLDLVVKWTQARGASARG